MSHSLPTAALRAEALRASGALHSLQVMARYHRWATRRVFESVAEETRRRAALSAAGATAGSGVPATLEALASAPAPVIFESLRGTMAHVAVVDDLWYQRLTTGASTAYDTYYTDDAPTDIWARAFGSWAEVCEVSLQRADRWVAFVDGIRAAHPMTDSTGSDDGNPAVHAVSGPGLGAALMGPSSATYLNTSGDTIHKPLWFCLQHVFNHGTHHRGQAHAAMTALGFASTPALDLTAMPSSEIDF